MWYWIIGGGALLWLMTRNSPVVAGPVPTAVTTCSSMNALLSEAGVQMQAALLKRGIAIIGGGVSHDVSNPNKHVVGASTQDVGLVTEMPYTITFEADAFGGVTATTKHYGVTAPSIAAMCELLPSVVATL